MNSQFYKWLVTVTMFSCLIFVATSVTAKEPIKPPPPSPEIMQTMPGSEKMQVMDEEEEEEMQRPALSGSRKLIDPGDDGEGPVPGSRKLIDPGDDGEGPVSGSRQMLEGDGEGPAPGVETHKSLKQQQ